MSQSASCEAVRSPTLVGRSPFAFGLTALGMALAAAVLAGWVPVRFSIVTVFLFAGPHNWLEFRYFLTRMPARWGRLRGFFLLAFAGIFGLTGGYAALVYLFQTQHLSEEAWDILFPCWGTLLLFWIATLTHLRSRQNPRREWGLVWPAAFGLVALAWLFPWWCGVGLVYLHPLMAFWLLDRELKRSRPQWRPAFHACLACLPVFLGVLWWKLAGAPSLPDADELSQAVTRHAGADVLQGVSTHLLVATHTFLEMLHYAVWVVAVPLIGLRAAPWKLDAVPLARRSPAWRIGLYAFLGLGLAAVVILWGGFVADYTTTRNVYFTIALAHVLAEVPFLLRAL
jgi:hypothetical protein